MSNNVDRDPTEDERGERMGEEEFSEEEEESEEDGAGEEEEDSSVDPTSFTPPDRIYKEARKYHSQRSTEDERGYAHRNAEWHNVKKAGDEPRKAKANEEDPDTFEVFVKDHRGHNHTCRVKKGDTVDDLQREIHRKVGVPPEQQRLQTDKALNLVTGLTLAAAGVVQGTILFSTGRLRGGFAW